MRRASKPSRPGPFAISSTLAAWPLRPARVPARAGRPQLNRRSRYTLFFSGSTGYEIVDRDGIAPAVGTPIIVAGKRLVVESIRRLPFERLPPLKLEEAGRPINA